MQVASDPLPLLDDRQGLHPLAEPRVLDGQTGVRREALDEGLVLIRKLPRAALVREVEVPDGLAPDRDRDAQE